MITINTLQCRTGFAELEDDRHRARSIDGAFPECACEQCSVGIGSPGPVTDCEDLYRFFVSPADIDPKTNDVFVTAFEKAAENGLSVFRGSASDDDIINLVSDRLTVKLGRSNLTVLGLFRVVTIDLRAVKSAGDARTLCVYDETVRRKLCASLPHVPTHVSIYQRVPPQGQKDRKRQIDSDNYKLYSVLIKQRIDVAEFRNGLLVELNRRSLAGEFVLPLA